MKAYQLIYTSVKNSLSDPELGLTNKPGLRVFSCTQGLTKKNIDEIIRFATYRLPKNDDTEYSKTPCDPSVPEQFPKIFRTFKLSDGRYVAMQVSYAGCNFEGQAGNVFAHAFIFDDVPDDFMPEQYYGHPSYRTHLTEKNLSGQIVHYLKPLGDIQPTEGLEDEIIDFIDKHKNELTYILDKAMMLLTSNDIRNICIATNEFDLTVKYLLALKWLLPRDGGEHLGISSYNVYLPSDKQRQIVFHGTVKGRNNITQQAVDVRKNCIYIDVENTKFERDANSLLFKFSVKELREIYAKYKFQSPKQLLAWEATWENTTKTGIAGKLIRLKKTTGDDAFKTRVMEIYPAIEDANMANVKFELSKIMFDNLSLFESEQKRVTEIYMVQCIDKICSGENIEIGNPFGDDETSRKMSEAISSNLGKYMSDIRENIDDISDVNILTLLRLFGHVKHASGKSTWRELFTDTEDLKLFVLMASHITITGSGKNAFTNVEDWTMEDLAELIAYFDSSTKDERLKKSCEKFICTNNKLNWEDYGISVTTRKKTHAEAEKDIEKIQRMLQKVGYIPYQTGTYAQLRSEVADDMRNSNSPLLLSRLLQAVYNWQGSFGNQIQAEKNAKIVRKLLLEMRKSETSCYNYLIPKLALEIIESNGHYHEIIINTETMPVSFWNWFLIGYSRCRRDESKMLSYTRVYAASKSRMSRVPAKKALRDTFQEVVD